MKGGFYLKLMKNSNLIQKIGVLIDQQGSSITADADIT